MAVRMPVSYPTWSSPCDLRLAQEALAYRVRQNPPLTTPPNTSEDSTSPRGCISIREATNMSSSIPMSESPN